jgi:hypothetical protein
LKVLRFLQTVDRRFLYALLFLAVGIPLLRPIRLPVIVTPSTRKVYDEVQSLPANGFVLVSVDWSAGTRGENGPQTEAILRHLMKHRLRFAIISFDPQGPLQGQKIATRIQGDYGYKEGVNWTNLGYKVDIQDYLKAFVLDVPAAAPQDIHGTPTASLPVMAGIRSAHDIQLIIDITPSDTYTSFIKFMQGPFKDNMKMAVALTSVMAPEAANYVRSGQLVGSVVGLKGAIEYESNSGVVGQATACNASLSFAHVLIIVFIVLGNVAMVLERIRARREGSQ